MKNNRKQILNTSAIASAICFYFIATLNLACMPEKNDDLSIGKAAFEAWQTGELTGDYTAFQKMLASDFDVFSHPTFVRGVFRGEEARKQMILLMESRRQTPNNLTFSNAVFLSSPGQVAAQFDSEGTVMQRYPYKGYNVIVFSVKDGMVTGFREYFGDIEPAWFQSR